MNCSARLKLSSLLAVPWLLAPQAVFAQSAATGTTPPSGHFPVPDHALYFFLFDHISNQDKLAGRRSRPVRMATTSGTTTQLRSVWRLPIFSPCTIPLCPAGRRSLARTMRQRW